MLRVAFKSSVELEIEEEIFLAATRDPLTGLGNRRHFTEIARPILAHAHRAGSPVAALLMDLDHFKRINDTHGHAAGDAVLRGFAGLAQGFVRQEDLLCRHGGEEFLALLPGCDLATGFGLAERIRAAVEAHPFDCGGTVLRVTLSGGLALLGVEETLECLTARADSALYRAKESGRNRILSDSEGLVAG